MKIESIRIAEVKTGYLIQTPGSNQCDGVYHYDNSTDAMSAIVNLLDESAFTVVSTKEEFDKLVKTSTGALALLAERASI